MLDKRIRSFKARPKNLLIAGICVLVLGWIWWSYRQPAVAVVPNADSNSRVAQQLKRLADAMKNQPAPYATSQPFREKNVFGADVRVEGFGDNFVIYYAGVSRDRCVALMQERFERVIAIGIDNSSPGWRAVPVTQFIAETDCSKVVNQMHFQMR